MKVNKITFGPQKTEREINQEQHNVVGSGGNIGDVGTAVAGSKNAFENNNLLAIQMSVTQIQQSTAAMLGIQGSSNNANEQISLAVVEALKNMGKLAADAYEKLTDGEKAKFVHELVKEMSPDDKAKIQYQIKLDVERNQVATGNRPKADSLNDYLTKNDYLTNLHKEISDSGSLQLPGYPIPEPLPPLPGLSIPEQDKDAGKFVTPIIVRDKNEGIYAGPEISVGNWQDSVLTSDKPYEPNKGSVGNMGEFLGQSGFGADVKNNSTKTKQQYGGQSIHVATDDMASGINKGDKFYLDGLHKDHIDVFDSRGRFKFVLNLDGTKNDVKTDAGRGRRLPK
ncbi:hypothetical protein RHO14_07860 [Orbus wheelerorum]|uniref:hypothetical protein n=1 Tax=Orbus wheelerorum TaxID=3074111 RepID=UPI00370D4BC6